VPGRQEASVSIDGIARATRLDQKLKTASSERLAPLHSKLLSLGFLEYVTKVKEAGNERVFPVGVNLP
jgi:hypothetical protein